MSKYTVSIFMLTYNQEPFIAQAIEGVLMQKTNFEIQLVIGEDCSTDATRVICEQYALKYSTKIKLLPNLDKNIGLIANYMRTIKECDGTYIAICDGDDYWIDDRKLQKQVDFLENNPDYFIVGANYSLLYPNGEIIDIIKQREKFEYDFDDLIFNNLIASVTVLFKNIPLKDPLPTWILKFPYGDWPTYLWVVKNKGKIHFFKEKMAMYRAEIGVSASIIKTSSEILKVNISILESIAIDSTFSHKLEIISKSIFRLKMNLIGSYNKEGEFGKALKEFLKNIFRLKEKYSIIKMYFYSLFIGLKLFKNKI